MTAPINPMKAESTSMDSADIEPDAERVEEVRTGDDVIRLARPRVELPSVDDPFDPRNLRVSQDFGAAVPVKRVVTTIVTEKPRQDMFFRTHPDSAYAIATAVLEVNEPRREVYLVAPSLRSAFASDLKVKTLVTVITRDDNLRIWPISTPDATGRSNAWSESAFDAVERAKRRWVRVVANMPNGSYDVLEAIADLPEPNWPDLTPKQVLEIAFGQRYIADLNHPVLRRLRGVV